MSTFARYLIVAMLALPLFSVATVDHTSAKPKDRGRDRGATDQRERRQEPASNDEMVLVVWDATVESDCRVQVSTDGGPWVEEPCAPGSVIASKQVTRKEAKLVPGGTVFPLTGDLAQDEALNADAVEQVHLAIDQSFDAQSAASTMAACVPLQRALEGSYNMGSGYKTIYALGYKINSDCSVTNISDRAKTNAAGNGGVWWERSCSNGNPRCYERDMQLYSSYVTGFLSLPNSSYGRYYESFSTLYGCTLCTNYSGYWSFD
jgi:hypothetical protein